MGAGKTTTGKRLAKVLGYRFEDLDRIIEHETGRSIAEFFLSEGEESFRTTESGLLKSLKGEDQIIIATGGGTPCFHENLEWMNSYGITVYLQTPPRLIYGRLKKGKLKRPLIAGLSDAGLRQYIEVKLRERESFYLKSHLIISDENIDIEELASVVIRKARQLGFISDDGQSGGIYIE